MMLRLGQDIKTTIDDIIANPSKYSRDKPIEIIWDYDRIVAYEGDPEYDRGFENDLMPVKLTDDFFE